MPLYAGNPYLFASEPPPPGDWEVVMWDTDAINATASPVVTLTGYDPVEGDIVVAWFASSSSATLNTVLSGWANVLGGTTIADPGDGTCICACLLHPVTSGEEGADTNAWTFTGMWNVPETGTWIAGVFRNGDPTTPLMAAAAAVDSLPVATHTLAGVGSGSITASNGLVVSAVFPDTTETYTTPAGWTNGIAAGGGLQGGNSYVRDTLTTSGVAVAATNITPSGANEYAGITVVLNKAP
jgi:hypothetical protein